MKSKLASQLGIGDHGVKTDRRDAQALSEVSTRIALPSIHIPSKEARERKALCNSREALVQARTKLINSVRGNLRPLRIGISTGGAETLPARARKRLAEHPEGMPIHLERVLTAIEALNKEIVAAEKELTGLAEDDKECVRSMSMPGVGPLTAVRFKAVIDEESRFKTAHRLESYLGLTPGERSSSDKKRTTGITKAGSTRLRWLLVQAAWSLMRCRPNDPMAVWAKEVAHRRGKQVAIVALARKMAGVLFAMWRDEKDYDPSIMVMGPTRRPPKAKAEKAQNKKA